MNNEISCSSGFIFVVIIFVVIRVISIEESIKVRFAEHMNPSNKEWIKGELRSRCHIMKSFVF
jgi:hypothetical protein